MPHNAHTTSINKTEYVLNKNKVVPYKCRNVTQTNPTKTDKHPNVASKQSFSNVKCLYTTSSTVNVTLISKVKPDALRRRLHVSDTISKESLSNVKCVSSTSSNVVRATPS